MSNANRVALCRNGLLLLSLGGACHPPGGSDPTAGRPPDPPGASAAPPAVTAAATASSPGARAAPSPEWLGSTCAELEPTGARAAAALLEGAGDAIEWTTEDGARAPIAAAQCAVGERLERQFSAPVGSCSFLEVALLAPVRRATITVTAHPTSGLAPMQWEVGPTATTRLPEGGRCLLEPGSAAPLRFELTVSEGGGTVAARVASVIRQ